MVANLAELDGNLDHTESELWQSEINTRESDGELGCDYPDIHQLTSKRFSLSLMKSIRGSVCLNYHWHEILIAFCAIAYAVVHFLVSNVIVSLVFGILFLGMQMWVMYKNTRSVRWAFFNIWIKQMKVIILSLSSLTILWIDLWWGIIKPDERTIVGTIVVNATILFFLWVDLMSMTIFLRALIPGGLLIIGVVNIFDNVFRLEDFPLWTFQGHLLQVWDIQNVAWSQILVLSFLGLKAVATDRKHKKFYFIEENEQRGADYSTKGWTWIWTDIAMLITFLVYVCTYRFEAKIRWQVVSGLLFLLVGIPFLKGVKLKCSYFLHYRPGLLILAAVVILFCDIYRRVLSKTQTKEIDHSIYTVVYVYCVVLAILSDFHTGPTNIFRLLLPFLMVIVTGISVYYYLFVVPDVGLITIWDHTLGVNSVKRNAYFQVLFLLKCQLVSLIEDPSHSKFFLLPKRCERGALFERFSTRIERRL